MTTYRIRYKNYISELYLPEKQNGRVFVFLPGLPSSISKSILTKTLTERGFVVYQPFFSGSYDSSGVFSPSQCVRDAIEFVAMAKRTTVKELYFGKKINIMAKSITLGGISYGGSIAALASQKLGKKIDGLILINPVLEYRNSILKKLNFESLNFSKKIQALMHLLRTGYPHTYRINKSELGACLAGKDKQFIPWINLKHNHHAIFVLSGEKDPSVPKELNHAILAPVLKENDAMVTAKGAGHSLSSFDSPKLFNEMINFLLKT